MFGLSQGEYLTVNAIFVEEAVILGLKFSDIVCNVEPRVSLGI